MNRVWVVVFCAESCLSSPNFRSTGFCNQVTKGHACTCPTLHSACALRAALHDAAETVASFGLPFGAARSLCVTKCVP